MSSTMTASPAVTSYPFENIITSHAALRDLMGTPGKVAIDKEITYLDPHSQNFIEHSPFLLIATSERRRPRRCLAEGRSGRVRQSPQ